MAKLKTAEEVQAEIVALTDVKPFVPQRTFFGNDNHAKIDAQLWALRETDDEEDADEKWADEEDHEVMEGAKYAIRWKNGEEDVPPSKDWASIDSRKKTPKKSPPARAARSKIKFSGRRRSAR